MLELFGTKGCPYTTDLRESLLWDGQEFVEYDVEEDQEAFKRLMALTDGTIVPVLVEDERIIQIGYLGRGCTVAHPSTTENASL